RDALAVGYVIPAREGAAPVLAPDSPHGPIARSERIKPDLVSWKHDETAAIAGGGDASEMRASRAMAIAGVAGHVAQLMVQRPGLTAIEAKNLLVGTAQRDVVRASGAADAPIAEPTAAGA